MAATPQNIYADLIKAQQAFKPIVKDNAVNAGNMRYKYADLKGILEAVLPALNDNGLALVQATTVEPTGDMAVETRLYHVSGESITSTYPVRCADPLKPQTVGSALTYARRYALMAMLGLAAEDDDGQRAQEAEPVLSPRATSRPQTLQHEAEKPENMSDFDLPQPVKSTVPDDVFGPEVRRAMTDKDGPLLRALVDEAGDHPGRWITLVKASDSPDALDWVVKQIERRGVASDLLLLEVGKQRDKLGVAPSPRVRQARRENVLPNLTPDDVEAGRAVAERATR